MSAEDLKVLRKEAERTHAALRRREAAERVSKKLGGDKVTEDEKQSIRALLTIERRKQHMTKTHRTMLDDGIPMAVPGVCIAGWWRGRTDWREEILSSLLVVPTDDELMKLAGKALAAVPRRRPSMRA